MAERAPESPPTPDLRDRGEQLLTAWYPARKKARGLTELNCTEADVVTWDDAEAEAEDGFATAACEELTASSEELTAVSRHPSEAATQEQDNDAPCSQESISEPIPPLAYIRRADSHGASRPIFARDILMVGRHTESDLKVTHPAAHRHHCRIHASEGQVELEAIKPVHVKSDSGPWTAVEAGLRVALRTGHRFRLVNASAEDKAATTFCVDGLTATPIAWAETSDDLASAGSASFDAGYLKLLTAVHEEGGIQQNKKGANRTLQRPFHLEINLCDKRSERQLLPITTLRLLTCRHAISEALWYLRGESDISFLKRHKNPFWDQQATKDADGKPVVGLNYGLLTNFPQGDGAPPQNQLETRVLERLCKGESSRNMTCTLTKPGETTEQEACTQSIQFLVRDGSLLDLQVHQRSSDVVLGLPHDVVVWAIILHLVCREVARRTDDGRRLMAGKLHFNVASAHAYDVNRSNLEGLLMRQPRTDVAPHLEIDATAPGMFEIAADMDGPGLMRVIGYPRDAVHPSMKVEQAL